MQYEAALTLPLRTVIAFLLENRSVVRLYRYTKYRQTRAPRSDKGQSILFDYYHGFTFSVVPHRRFRVFSDSPPRLPAYTTWQ